MTAPVHGAELLDFADDVLGASAPLAARRRAVSTAYYAVFHELIGAAVRRLLGGEPGLAADRHTASRWYSHHDIRVVSGWVQARVRRQKIPDAVGALLDFPPPDLVTLTRLVTELQEARLAADYDHTFDPTVDEARETVGSAQPALHHLAGLAGDRVSDNYLMLLLGGPRLPGR